VRERRIAAEAVGTAFLLMAVVGSGIMGERLSQGNVGLALLASSIATAGALAALILTFGPISGAHLNPAVTLSFLLRLQMNLREALSFWTAQLAGAVTGVLAANVMFGEALVAWSRTARRGPGQWLSEAVATFGLVAVVWGSRREGPRIVAASVSAYILAAYWFTSSTSFANPAVTVARAFTDTFTGIAPGDVSPFVASQLVGALAATAFFAWVAKRPADDERESEREASDENDPLRLHP
jgi:glycerol uptake facilitator-like aquaporin